MWDSQFLSHERKRSRTQLSHRGCCLSIFRFLSHVGKLLVLFRITSAEMILTQIDVIRILWQLYYKAYLPQVQRNSSSSPMVIDIRRTSIPAKRPREPRRFLFCSLSFSHTCAVSAPLTAPSDRRLPDISVRSIMSRHQRSSRLTCRRSCCFASRNRSRVVLSTTTRRYRLRSITRWSFQDDETTLSSLPACETCFELICNVINFDVIIHYVINVYKIICIHKF